MKLPALTSDERRVIQDAIVAQIVSKQRSLVSVHDWASLYGSTMFEVRTLQKVLEAIK